MGSAVTFDGTSYAKLALWSMPIHILGVSFNGN